jgi:hypothetical protein
LYFLSRRKSAAEVDKLEAETAGLYAEMANKSAKRESDSITREMELRDYIIALEDRLTKRESESLARERELRDYITVLEIKVNNMSYTIDLLKKTNGEKDVKIAYLEQLSRTQATKIANLEDELATFRSENK